jgi:hypothetical protein
MMAYRTTWNTVPESEDQEELPAIIKERDQYFKNGTLVPKNDPNILDMDYATDVGYEISWDAALIMILILDYVCQLIAIMVMLLANFVIDYGIPSATDRMNEIRFSFKLSTMITTSVCSNIVIT